MMCTGRGRMCFGSAHCGRRKRSPGVWATGRCVTDDGVGGALDLWSSHGLVVVGDPGATSPATAPGHPPDGGYRLLDPTAVGDLRVEVLRDADIPIGGHAAHVDGAPGDGEVVLARLALAHEGFGQVEDHAVGGPLGLVVDGAAFGRSSVPDLRRPRPPTSDPDLREIGPIGNRPTRKLMRSTACPEAPTV